jgi:hypothetical protein
LLTKEDQEYDVTLELVKEWIMCNLKVSGAATFMASVKGPNESVRQLVERLYREIESGRLRA